MFNIYTVYYNKFDSYIPFELIMIQLYTTMFVDKKLYFHMYKSQASVVIFFSDCLWNRTRRERYVIFAFKICRCVSTGVRILFQIHMRISICLSETPDIRLQKA